MTRGGWKAPSTHSKGTDLAITSEPEKSLSDKSSDKLPPVFAGLDKAEALAYVNRLFDAAAAGAVLWGDKLLLKRFLEQCSRTRSQETKDGYRRELQHFTRWRDQNHPHLHLRELDPALVDEWVSRLREQVAGGELKPRSFNRRVSAVSALYRWASQPTRAGVTGVPRNPIPRAAEYRKCSCVHSPAVSGCAARLVAVVRRDRVVHPPRADRPPAQYGT